MLRAEQTTAGASVVARGISQIVATIRTPHDLGGWCCRHHPAVAWQALPAEALAASLKSVV